MRVLLVEDESAVVLGLTRALRGAGYEVDVATDGATGLDLAVAGPYDVIVLDVLLPRLNGFRVCQEVRARGVTTPILMLSAKSGEWDIAEGLDLGADDYLTKPFSTIELLARVRALARDHAGSSISLANGSLRLDPYRRRCWRGDVPIELTSRESRLLAVLFDKVGDVVGKQELLARAWGDGHSGDANVVEVYVGRLRRKLDAPFGTDDIETIRGAGYRLRPGP